MAKIVKVYQEHAPVRFLAGKCYHAGDRDAHGLFSARWEDWFQDNCPALLEAQIPAAKGCSLVGAMRMHEGVFEYWIGVLLDTAADVPAPFSGVAVAEGDYAVAWIQGRDDGALYGMHDACMQAFRERGWTPADGAWYIERYACPRFTSPDANGEVILDYLVQLNP